MIQLGPEMTADTDIMHALLARFGVSEQSPPKDEEVVEIVSQLSRLASEGAVPCDVGALVHTLATLVSSHPRTLMVQSPHTRPESEPRLVGRHQGV